MIHRSTVFLLVIAINVLAATFAYSADKQTPKPPVGVPKDARYFIGKWYYVYFAPGIKWHQAKAKCESLGGQLVIIPDEPTWAFVKALTPAFVWLGATDEKTERIWVWVDGTPLKFSAWLRDQPDNMNNNEHYLVTRGDKWNDAPADGKRGNNNQVAGYICEWKAR